jgi:hypothetical protein
MQHFYYTKLQCLPSIHCCQTYRTVVVVVVEIAVVLIDRLTGMIQVIAVMPTITVRDVHIWLAKLASLCRRRGLIGHGHGGVFESGPALHVLRLSLFSFPFLFS